MSPIIAISVACVGGFGTLTWFMIEGLFWFDWFGISMLGKGGCPKPMIDVDVDVRGGSSRGISGRFPWEINDEAPNIPPWLNRPTCPCGTMGRETCAFREYVSVAAKADKLLVSWKMSGKYGCFGSWGTIFDRPKMVFASKFWIFTRGCVWRAWSNELPLVTMGWVGARDDVGYGMGWTTLWKGGVNGTNDIFSRDFSTIVLTS